MNEWRERGRDGKGDRFFQFFRRGRPPDAVARKGVFFADSNPWGFLFDIFSSHGAILGERARVRVRER